MKIDYCYVLWSPLKGSKTYYVTHREFHAFICYQGPQLDVDRTIEIKRCMLADSSCGTDFTGNQNRNEVQRMNCAR